MPMHRSQPQAFRERGFTLIELLVAIGLLALMAALSWRGLDGMTAGRWGVGGRIGTAGRFWSPPRGAGAGDRPISC